MSTISSIPLSRLGRAALRYAEHGWRIFPCHPRSKVPSLKGWQAKATTVPGEIRRWWSYWPDANIGLATGQQSGVVVVDLDLKKGGPDNWAGLVDIHGTVGTLESLTGSGGNHLFFVAPNVELKNTASVLAPGIDTKAEGGFAILPPSVHRSGGLYEWRRRVLPEPLPEWLLDRWPKRGDRNLPCWDSPAMGAETRPKAWQLLNGPISDGQRNDALTRLAGWIRLYHPEHVAAAMLQAWNLGLCNPPLPEDEVTRIVISVYRYPQPGVNGHPKAVVPNYYREDDNGRESPL